MKPCAIWVRWIAQDVGTWAMHKSGTLQWIQRCQAPNDLPALTLGTRTLCNKLTMLARSFAWRRPYRSDTVRRRSALAITLTEDSAIAAAAMIGDSSNPKSG